ncbi:MAG: NADP-dependent malic enzyme [Mesorhizobium sp.]|nr:MAG: NADP-dependent malic enzyme [Mesorhizobium sp.]
MARKTESSGPSVSAQEALEFHAMGRPGKLEIVATKPMATQRDLSLAYSPGVAVPVRAIAEDPSRAFDYTTRGNMVAVISNGTAILGLGNLGALASKPVMEGKSVLFKRFADVDSIDLEVATEDADEFINCVRFLGPSFGGINLEDIKAPECFVIEQRLRELMDIPVFHDDQHGTAIISAAGLINALEITGRDMKTTKMVCNGAGAAGIACIELMKAMGFSPENIILCDTKGVVFQGRTEGMNQWKSAHAVKTEARSLAEALDGCDVFLGLSAKGALTPAMVQSMAKNPIIFAMANPDPEITPEEVGEIRTDAIMATGRSDYPNQVNNVLGFPYIFRGALDVRATTINDEMKIAAVRAIAALAREEPSDVAARAYSGETPVFGPDFLIPSPFDPRLILRIAPAVAKAACDTGVATRPIADFAAYVDKLNRFVFRSGLVMKPVFSSAKAASAKRVIYADGEDERVLRAAQVVLEEGIAEPILIGRPHVVEVRLKRYGLRIRPGVDFGLINPEDDPRYRHYVDLLIELAGRRGITTEAARTMVRTNNTVIAALALKRGDADAMICGLEGRFERHLRNVTLIIGPRPGIKDRDLSTLSMLISQRGIIFLTDTHVSVDPTAEEIAEMTVLAAEEIQRFGIEPKAALLSHSDFGSRDSPGALKMREAAAILARIAPELQCDGEMHADSALSEHLRQRVYPHSRLKGEANLLVFPNLDSANITLTALRAMMDALHVGPILLGTDKPAHILTPSVTSRGVVNMTALAVVEAAHKAQALAPI